VIQRHRARRLALQGLCCVDAQGPQALEPIHHFIGDSREDPKTLVEARRLLNETLRLRDELDEVLRRHARHWDLSRLALVDRNILRLAACELWLNETPVRVAISEALKLAQEFSTAESPRFINGVLDPAAKEITGQV
jgi:N utilization substance protein B